MSRRPLMLAAWMLVVAFGVVLFIGALVATAAGAGR